MKIMFISFLSLFFTQSLLAHKLPFDAFYAENTKNAQNKKVFLMTAVSYTLTKEEINTIFVQNSQYFDFVSWLEDHSGASVTDVGLNIVSAGKATGEKTDGQVDHLNKGDDFYKASVVAITTCNAYAVINNASFASALVPRFTAPASFTTGKKAAVEHHYLYEIAQSVSFDCVYQGALTEHLPDERLKHR